MLSLSGQTALVTGSSRGLGRAIAVALAQAGADVAVNFRYRASEAHEVVAAVIGQGRRSALVQADVSHATEVEHMVGLVEEQLGPVSILVNNAGIARVQPVVEITESDWDEIIDVNLKSCFLVTQRVLPRMRLARFGRIVNLSSVAAQLGGVVGPHYAASKAGIIGLTHSYANLVVKEGVTVNAIAPALIRSEMVTQNLNASPDRIPMGRFGEPEEVASVVVMLASNGFITGQTINVNGGWYMSS